jgi:UDP-N-acetylmuramyl pentapeptide synthase
MIPYRMNSGAAIIDDSHPTDPLSVRSSLEYMRIYNGKKILVLTPMTTIDKQTASDHYALAKEIATTCDYLFLTNRHYSRQFVKGFYESGGGCIIKYGSQSAIASFIMTQLKSKEDIAVLEGEDTQLILPELLKRFR